ncbi:exosortase C-terminal domain/associated protein EpsI [Thermodesulfobacteriota bacterium]
MGNKIEIKLSILSILFLFTCAFIYWPTEPLKTKKKTDIGHYIEHIDGYRTLRRIDLEDNALQMLKLDDYAYYDYQRGLGKVNLYIGYYYTANKAYASHSPLICYPSQGWKIDKHPITSTLKAGRYKINLEEVITSYGQGKELVLYWYQTYQNTNTQVYKNKIDMAVNKIKHNDEQHGFVRVSTSLTDSSYDEAKMRAADFIRAFYPKFIAFINEG